MKEFILEIERLWGVQRTTMTVYAQGENKNVLKVSTSFGDVLKSIKEEVGSVTFVLTQKEFEKRFDRAIIKVLNQIGSATKQYASNIQDE